LGRKTPKPPLSDFAPCSSIHAKGACAGVIIDDYFAAIERGLRQNVQIGTEENWIHVVHLAFIVARLAS